jgi:hypothetical protein
MDTVQKENITKFLSNTAMLYHMVKDYLDNDTPLDRVISLVRTQNSSNHHILQDLGVDMDERTKSIRMLNEKVRQLEEKLGTSQGVTLESAAQFIHSKKQQIENALKAIGVSGNMSLSANSAIDGSLKIYHHSKKPFRMFEKNEAEVLRAQQDHEAMIALFSAHFDTELIKEEHIGEHTAMLYTERNLQTLEDFMSKHLGIDVGKPKLELNMIGGFVTIDQFSFCGVVLEQHRILQAAFSRF